MFTNCIASTSLPHRFPLLRLLQDIRRHYWFQAAAPEDDTAQIRIQDEAAAILDRHGNSILRLAYSHLHNLDDAEEILQETLIRFMEAAPLFENYRHERTWLLQVAGNLSKNRIAYNRIRTTDELQETLVSEQRDDLSFVWDAVKSLAIQYREVIHLYYYEGYSTEEIARILRRKESTVRSQLKRGREQLKILLKEEYDFEGSL